MHSLITRKISKHKRATLSKCTLSIFRSILAFIMIPLMQQQLDEFRCTVWNTHRIRAQKDTFMADGVPNHIFEFPERYGMERQGRDNLI